MSNPFLFCPHPCLELGSDRERSSLEGQGVLDDVAGEVVERDRKSVV